MHLALCAGTKLLHLSRAPECKGGTKALSAVDNFICVIAYHAYPFARFLLRFPVQGDVYSWLKTGGQTWNRHGLIF